jgi:flagellar motility protein MotE (MotC chaperone)
MGRSMMDLGELATAGATTLVAAMTTGAWEQVRKRIAGLLGRKDEAEQRVLESDLDRARAELVGAAEDQVAAAEIRGELRGQLVQLLRANPELAEELEALLTELGAETKDRVEVRQHAVADRGGTVIQGGRDVRDISVGTDRRPEQ